MFSGNVKNLVRACAVCRTNIHVIDGDLPDPVLPLIPGHEIVSEVMEVADDVRSFKPGDIVGVPWLGWTCEQRFYCINGKENLCDNARFTGYHINGGYAEMTVADWRIVFP